MNKEQEREIARREETMLRRLGTIKTPRMILDETFRNGTITQATVRKYTERVMARIKDMPAEFLHLVAMEVEGGDCPKCGKPWKPVPAKIEVRTDRGDLALGIEPAYKTLCDFVHYRPSCRCYGFCRACGNSLHREVEAGTAPACGSCGFDPRKPRFAAKKRRAAKKEEKIDAALED